MVADYGIDLTVSVDQEEGAVGLGVVGYGLRRTARCDSAAAAGRDETLSDDGSVDPRSEDCGTIFSQWTVTTCRETLVSDALTGCNLGWRDAGMRGASMRRRSMRRGQEWREPRLRADSAMRTQCINAAALTLRGPIR
jgi:hypothetical protein